MKSSRDKRIINKKFVVRFVTVLMVVLTLFTTVGEHFAVSAADYKYDKDGKWLLTDTVKSMGYNLDNKSYAYNQLTRKERDLYDRLKRCVLNLGSFLERPNNIDNESILRTAEVFRSNEPELFWFDYIEWNADQIFAYYTINKYSEIKTKAKQIRKKTDNVLSKTSKMSSDYEKVKYFHDWIINNGKKVLYTGDKYDSECFLYKTLCGYPDSSFDFAQTFKYLCDVSGVEGVVVPGFLTYDYEDNNLIPYGYNLVKIDGNWYNIFIQWDFCTLYEGYTGKPCTVIHDFFLVPDSWLGNVLCKRGYGITYGDTGLIKWFSPPKATKTNMTYYAKNGALCETQNDIKKTITRQMKRILDNNKENGVIEFRCPAKLADSADSVKDMFFEACYQLKNDGYDFKNYYYDEPVSGSYDSAYVYVKLLVYK